MEGGRERLGGAWGVSRVLKSREWCEKVKWKTRAMGWRHQ